MSRESTDFLAVPGIAARAGGTLVYSQCTEPKTFNPLISTDSASREVIDRMTRI